MFDFFSPWKTTLWTQLRLLLKDTAALQIEFRCVEHLAALALLFNPVVMNNCSKCFITSRRGGLSHLLKANVFLHSCTPYLILKVETQREKQSELIRRCIFGWRVILNLSEHLQINPDTNVWKDRPSVFLSTYLYQSVPHSKESLFLGDKLLLRGKELLFCGN